MLGNIGAPLRDGSFEPEEDEDVDIIRDQQDVDILEKPRDDVEDCSGMASAELSHDVVEECVAGSSRVTAIPT